jgi:hypothetical protein
MPLTKDELMEFLASLPWKFNAQGYAIIKRSHVVLWADGRKIGPKQIAHHINENKSDDRPENLQVVSWKEHARLHGLHERGGKTLGKLSPEQIEKRRQKMIGNKFAVGKWSDERKAAWSVRQKELWRKEVSEKRNAAQSAAMKRVWQERREGKRPTPNILSQQQRKDETLQ